MFKKHSVKFATQPDFAKEMWTAFKLSLRKTKATVRCNIKASHMEVFSSRWRMMFLLVLISPSPPPHKLYFVSHSRWTGTERYANFCVALINAEDLFSTHLKWKH